VTAYCPCRVCCGRWARYGRTATGERARFGLIAVDPAVIPLGSRVRIQGWSAPFKASDTGSAIKGRRLDICFSTHAEAVAFGVQKLRVWTPKPKDKLGVNEAVDGLGSAVGRAIDGIGQ
jgi:3D (Asp-Asp-Asp) domain-containing protein